MFCRIYSQPNQLYCLCQSWSFNSGLDGRISLSCSFVYPPLLHTPVEERAGEWRFHSRFGFMVRRFDCWCPLPIPLPARRGEGRSYNDFIVICQKVRCAPEQHDHCLPLDFLLGVRHIGLTMKTATVRDLRNHFPRVAAWIEEGESVDITKSGKVIARLMPATRQTPRKFKMPDVMARLQRTFGDSCYDSSDMARGLELSRGDIS